MARISSHVFPLHDIYLTLLQCNLHRDFSIHDEHRCLNDLMRRHRDHPMVFAVTRALCALAVLMGAGTACSPQQPEPSTAPTPSASCLPGERGYLRLSLRGAIDRDLNWHGAGLQCEGGARPAGNGLRVSFAGPADDKGSKLRIVFGIGAHPGASASAQLPTNITVIVEGQSQLYATQGDGRCQVESLVQRALLTSTPASLAQTRGRAYRIAARGYCVDPATTLDGSDRLYINRFDFAGVADFEDNDLQARSEEHASAP